MMTVVGTRAFSTTPPPFVVVNAGMRWLVSCGGLVVWLTHSCWRRCRFLRSSTRRWFLPRHIRRTPRFSRRGAHTGHRCLLGESCGCSFHVRLTPTRAVRAVTLCGWRFRWRSMLCVLRCRRGAFANFRLASVQAAKPGAGSRMHTSFHGTGWGHHIHRRLQQLTRCHRFILGTGGCSDAGLGNH
jgi:hypothetical protein